MGTPLDDELRALRGRAYGPGADIHRDSGALERLRELEDAGRQHPLPAVASETRLAMPVHLPEEVDAQDAVLDEPELPARVWLRRCRDLTLDALRRLSRLRRSTVLVIIGLAALASVLVVALVLVERVQTDPFQVGADQVARLSIDPEYEVPRLFRGGAVEGTDPNGFEEFHGLRAIVAPAWMFFGEDSDGECVSVLVAANVVDPDSDSLSGPLFEGCAAGAFPAVAQFRVDGPELPEELRAAFSESTSLQFVYDSENREVVVFASE